jgi:DNA polymerase
VPANKDVSRYLRQLREQGETELALDSKTAAEAARSLASGAAPAQRSPRAAPPTNKVESKTAGADWRSVLRAQGADAPPPRVEVKPVDRRTSFPSATVENSEGAANFTASNTVVSPLPGAGLVVNHAPGDMFSSEPQFQSLDEIVKAVAVCTRCSLRAAALNPVPGEGNPRAELVCVGEGPGASEDESGRPFVGAAGQLLTQILAAIRLGREDVYICNVVKHRPPGNRTPLPDEVLACKPYLFRQLELIRPKVILALGASAAQTLLDTKLAIGKLRGAVHRYNGMPLIVTYHPAALLRNPAWKRPTWEDVQIARRILDGALQ